MKTIIKIAFLSLLNYIIIVHQLECVYGHMALPSAYVKISSLLMIIEAIFLHMLLKSHDIYSMYSDSVLVPMQFGKSFLAWHGFLSYHTYSSNMAFLYSLYIITCSVFCMYGILSYHTDSSNMAFLYSLYMITWSVFLCVCVL